ncbi:MAG: hypothetical protein ACRDLZ_08520 [Gaiellaceae bacterium]
MFKSLAESSDQADFRILFSGSLNGFETSRVAALGNQEAAFSKFNIPATPYGVIVNSQGVVVAASPLGSESALREFVSAGTKGGSVV